MNSNKTSSNRDWTANWIWKRDLRRLKNAYLYARKTFELSGDLSKARLSCCADSRYRLWVNGEYVGRGPVRSDPRFQYYDVYEDLPLRKGLNVIAFDVHYMGEGNLVYVMGPGGLLCQLDGECDGEKIQILTDESWRIKWSDAWDPATPRMNIMRGFIEHFDATREPLGWQQADFDDSTWAAAEILGPVGIAPWTSLIERDIPFLREKEVFPREIVYAKSFHMLPGYKTEVRTFPFQIARRRLKTIADTSAQSVDCVLQPDASCATLQGSEPRDGFSIVVDFGEEVCGFPRVRLKTEREGVIVDLAHSEILENGTVDPQSGFARGYYADRYIARQGTQEFEIYTPKGFRYLRADFSNLDGSRVEVESISINSWTYPVDYRGSFECSDGLLNTIWDVSRKTLEACMEDAFMCGPFRERAQWVGDAWCQAHVNYYLFGDLELSRKFLRQVAQSQREDGAMWGFYPADFPFGGDYVVPIWNMLWVKAVWEFYLFSGEREILDELFPTVLKFYEWLRDCEEDDGLLHDLNGWYFFDWSDNLHHTGSRAIYNLFYYDTIRDVRRIAEVLGRKDLATKLREKSEAMAPTIHGQYWDEARSAYVDYLQDGARVSEYSEHAQILAVLCGIAPKDARADLLKRVIAGEEEWVKVNTLFFSGILLLSLSDISLHTEALDYVRDLWGKYYEKHECANWPETCDFTQGSYCHGWGAWPGSFLMSEILGVKPSGPGFEEILVCPHPCDLEHAKGTVPTPKGDVSVGWSQKDQTFALDLSSPTKRNYLVKLPLPDDSSATVQLDGAVIWSEGKLVPRENVESRGREGAYLCFRLGDVVDCKIQCVV